MVAVALIRFGSLSLGRAQKRWGSAGRARSDDANSRKNHCASDFLIATPQGQIDFPSSKRLLFEVASASADLVAQNILLDMRNAHSELSATELWKLAAEPGRRHSQFSGKIAVLCRLTGTSQAAFFALCAENRGLPVRAFASFEQAVEWLIADGSRLLADIG